MFHYSMNGEGQPENALAILVKSCCLGMLAFLAMRSASLFLMFVTGSFTCASTLSVNPAYRLGKSYAQA